jgi:hypothetical protein
VPIASAVKVFCFETIAAAPPTALRNDSPGTLRRSPESQK